MSAEKHPPADGRSLETARRAGYFGKKILQKARNAQQEGRPVGWSMLTWYEGELIAEAMGMALVFPENYGALCAARQRAAPFLERSDDEGFPETLCGYARNCLGYASRLKENGMVPPAEAPGGGMPPPTVLIGSGAVCDARFKWFQALRRYFNAPQWTLERPQTGVAEFFAPDHREAAVAMIRQHLRQFVAFLEHTLKRRMDWDRLAEIVEQTLQTLQLAHQVDELRRAVPAPLAARDFYAVMVPHLYLPYDPEATEFYREVHREVSQRVRSGRGAVDGERYRVLFAELPPWHSLGFFDRLAERFGIAVVYESWGYHAPLPSTDKRLATAADPLERIARLTYGKYTEYNRTARELGVYSTRTAPYAAAARRYRADGLICHPLRSCRPVTYELFSTRDILEKQLKIPGVMIDGDIVDLRVFNQADALDRMEAFLETMDHYRHERAAAPPE